MPSRLGTCTLEILLCAVNCSSSASDRLFIAAMTSCELCGFLFHNRFQVGPHKRICRKRQHVSTIFPEAQEVEEEEEWDTTAAFSADEGGETEGKCSEVWQCDRWLLGGSRRRPRLRQQGHGTRLMQDALWTTRPFFSLPALKILVEIYKGLVYEVISSDTRL